ncbi:MAG TPA: S8 family serine peptidase [Prosthecobacter sp.]|nr:S8 family serine peptidase [Prosthecobacter sp.]
MKPPFARLLGAALLGAIAVLAWFEWQGARRKAPVAGDPPQTEKARRSPPAHLAAARIRPTQADQAQALEDLLAGRPLTLVEYGRPQRFRLSLHELFVSGAKAGERLREIVPQPHARALAEEAARASRGQAAGWVLYPEGGPEDPALRRILTHRLLVWPADRAAADALLAQSGFRALDDAGESDGPITAEAVSGNPASALEALAVLSRHSAVESVAPILMYQHAEKLVPSDPLFAQQWHLKNAGQGQGKAGTDANVSAVWDEYQGEDIRIGVIDDGLEITHPDLATNVDTTNDHDWNDNDNNPTPSAANGDTHGTAVAGIAAAAGNNLIGVSGVAPMATLVGFRLIADFTTDAQDGQAMSLHSDIIDIKSNSWGQPDSAFSMHPAGPELESGRKQSVTTGRGGRGTIFVWAAGNGRQIGDQGNKDGIANSIYAVTVGALANTGGLAPYSETGAHLTVVAPSSGGTRKVTTTDLTGNAGFNGFSDLSYTDAFTGTSAATPIVSGVAALMLEANPDLNWRDVKEILLRSATKIFPTDPGWTSRTGGDAPTLPAIKHHQLYGGGLVNASAAVQLAKTWTSVGPAIEVARTQTWPAPAPGQNPLYIPDSNGTGVTIPFDFGAAAPMRVEQVAIRLNIIHDYRGDLEITLRSPAGVVSTLATKEIRDSGFDYYDWTFSSMRHWGESAQGIWQVTLKDLTPGDAGYITSAKVTLHGAAAAPVQITGLSGPALLLAEGESLSLSGQTTGYGHVSHQWRRGATLVGSEGNYFAAAVTTAHAGSYQLTATNLTGTATGAAIPVGVVRRQISPVTVNEGTTLVLKTVAAGAGLTYDWFKGSDPVIASDRISGVQGPTLTIKSAAAADAADYFCRVSLPSAGLTLHTLPVTAAVRLKPIVTGAPMTPGVVSGSANYLFAAENGATRFTATGVPPGMSFNPKSGELSGRPTVAGTYAVKVTATNAAGTSSPLTTMWTVEPFPPLARGAYSGLVGRHASLNGGLGGRLTINVASSGSLTGTLTLGLKSYRFTGRMDALPGGADPSAHIVISRSGLPSLVIDFTLDLSGGLLNGSVGADQDQADLAGRRIPWGVANKTLGLGGLCTAFLQAAPETEGDLGYPQGQGYTVLTVSQTGGAIWAGKLADGTAITGGATVGGGGEVPLHMTLYAGTGSIQGWAAVTSTPVVLDGEWDWFKNAQADKSTTRSYKAGFPLHTLTVIGGRYSKPPPNTPVLGLPGTENNALVTFSSGALSSDLTQLFTVTPSNTVKMPAGTLNPRSVRLTLNAATGLISGSFTLKNSDPTDLTEPYTQITRTATFAGAMITRDGYNQARGQFLLNLLPDAGPPKTTATTSPTLSGLLLLQAPPP